MMMDWVHFVEKMLKIPHTANTSIARARIILTNLTNWWGSRSDFLAPSSVAAGANFFDEAVESLDLFIFIIYKN